MSNETLNKMTLFAFLLIAGANLALYWGEVSTMLWIVIATIFCVQNYQAMGLVKKVNVLNAELLKLLEHLQEMYSEITDKKDDTKTIQRES